jgi:hypothetical protein
MKAKMSRMTASYCGLKVEVVTQMENCTLICFGRTFIVDTADLTAGLRW